MLFDDMLDKQKIYLVKYFAFFTEASVSFVNVFHKMQIYVILRILMVFGERFFSGGC